MRCYTCYMSKSETEVSERPQVDLADRAGFVEVRGFTRAEVADALELLAHARVTQAKQADTSRPQLVRTFMRTEAPPTPPSSIRAAERLANHRDALLATPVHSYATLAQLREEKPSSTRTWFSRKRARHAVFALSHRGRTVIPAFQLTDSGDVRPDLAPILAPLREAGLDGWTVWTWMTSPSSLLSGQTPESVARTAPERASTAARRFAIRPAA